LFLATAHARDAYGEKNNAQNRMYGRLTVRDVNSSGDRLQASGSNATSIRRPTLDVTPRRADVQFERQ